jgi:hypothetical protein
MRSTILIFTALAAILAVPGAASAFEMDASAPDGAPSAPRFADPDESIAFKGLQALGPDGTSHFSDPADANTAPGSLKLLGGSLEVYGGSTDMAYGGLPNYIPGSPASSDLPPLLYSAPAIRSSH